MRSEGIRFRWLVACALGLIATVAEGQQGDAQRSARARQVLGLVDAKLVELDLPPASARAPFATAVTLAGRTELLELEPSDVRASGYRLLVERERNARA